MTNDIRQYCQNCDKCNRCNTGTLERGPLQPITVPKKVWSLTSIDIIGPLPETSRGNKYIVAVTDHFTKYPFACALPQKTAELVANFLYECICLFGCMDSIISDQGREFVNSVMDHLSDRFGFKHRITSPYHPESNGQRERDNRTLKSCLTKVVNDKQDNWDLCLSGALFAYRTSKHSSTKITPFEAVFGTAAKLPVEDTQQINANVLGEASTAYIESNIESRKIMHSLIHSNIQAAKIKQKKYFDSKIKVPTYVKDDLVLIKNKSRINRMGSKLQPMWLGPYRVHSVLPKNRIRLLNVHSNLLLKNIYNTSLLKRYTSNKEVPKEKAPPAVSETSSRNSLASGLEADTNKLEVKIIASIPVLSLSNRKVIRDSLGIFESKIVSFGKLNFSKPKRVHRCLGDGNCFFRAVSFFLSGSEEYHAILRNHIVTHMTTHCNSQLQKYLNEATHTYINDSGINNLQVWATDAEILGCASMLKCDIIVYAKCGQSFSWLRYPASFSLDDLSHEVIPLENISGYHYNVVISTEK